jgi:hypothetical protein
VQVSLSWWRSRASTHDPSPPLLSSLALKLADLGVADFWRDRPLVLLLAGAAAVCCAPVADTTMAIKSSPTRGT